MLGVIVVGTDFSEAAGIAVDTAARLARARGARLILVHATGADDPSLTSALHGTVEHRREAAVAASRARLGEAAEVLGRGGLDVEIAAPLGHADDALRSIGDRAEADLVVVGTRGLGGLDRLLAGTIAERVARGASRPVLVARGRPVAEGGFRRVLVATDFTRSGEPALPLGAALVADDEDARLELLHVLPPPFDESERRASRAQARDLAGKLAARHRAPIEASTHLVEGEAAEEICTRARATESDLVVVGSHGRRGVRRLLLGSVAEEVMQHGPCSVAIARPR